MSWLRIGPRVGARAAHTRSPRGCRRLGNRETWVLRTAMLPRRSKPWAPASGGGVSQDHRPCPAGRLRAEQGEDRSAAERVGVPAGWAQAAPEDAGQAVLCDRVQPSLAGRDDQHLMWGRWLGLLHRLDRHLRSGPAGRVVDPALPRPGHHTEPGGGGVGRVPPRHRPRHPERPAGRRGQAYRWQAVHLAPSPKRL